jgi:hypothetical protein
VQYANTFPPSPFISIVDPNHRTEVFVDAKNPKGVQTGHGREWMGARRNHAYVSPKKRKNVRSNRPVRLDLMPGNVSARYT